MVRLWRNPNRRTRRLQQAGGAGARAGGSHRAQDRAARHADHLRIHRHHAEPAAGQHRGARQRLPRQATVHGRPDRQGRPGAVPDGPETVHCVAQRSAGGMGQGQGRARYRSGQSESRQTAGRAECPVAEGPRRRQRFGTIDRRIAGGGESQCRNREAQSVVHHDRVAAQRHLGRRAAEGRRLSQPREQPVDDGVGAQSDVGEFQHFGKRNRQYFATRWRRA